MGSDAAASWLHISTPQIEPIIPMVGFFSKIDRVDIGYR